MEATPAPHQDLAPHDWSGGREFAIAAEHAAVKRARGSAGLEVLVTAKHVFRSELQLVESGPAPQLAAAEEQAAFIEELVARLRTGERAAKATLFDRYASHVLRVLARVLGQDAELPDLVQDVFTAAFSGIGRLRDPAALSGWLSQIAVFTARKHIRTKRRRRLIALLGFDAVPEVAVESVPVEVNDALRASYGVLERMSADERIAFALRYIEGMELTEAAAACGVSLATIKRRLGRARQRFLELAHDQPVLRDWVEGRS
jgi:RNA polymerase sigma-70 factor (ECF subfamily)